jgi:hypothetical protein
MRGPLLERAPALGGVFGAVVGTGHAALVPDMPEDTLDNMRRDAELGVHGGRDEPAKIVQDPRRDGVGELAVEPLLGASPGTERCEDLVARAQQCLEDGNSRRSQRLVMRSLILAALRR